MGVYGTGYNYPLYKLRSADDAAKLRRRRGRNGYNKAATVEFGNFVRQYLHNTNKAGGKKHQWLGWISKPEHLMTWPVWTDYNYQEPVVISKCGGRPHSSTGTTSKLGARRNCSRPQSTTPATRIRTGR